MSQLQAPEQDLVVLVADKNLEFTVKGILNRHQALGIKKINHTVIPYVMKNDPGCYQSSHDFLRSHTSKYKHALVIFDHHGCGQENYPARELEKTVRERLSQSGWDDRAEVVVITPELEAWVWSDSPQVAVCLGWINQDKDLRNWLEESGLWQQSKVKPSDPKKAVEKTLRFVRKPRSSKIYSDLAANVSFRRCEDPAFTRLCSILREWFPKGLNNNSQQSTSFHTRSHL